MELTANHQRTGSEPSVAASKRRKVRLEVRLRTAESDCAPEGKVLAAPSGEGHVCDKDDEEVAQYPHSATVAAVELLDRRSKGKNLVPVELRQERYDAAPSRSAHETRYEHDEEIRGASARKGTAMSVSVLPLEQQHVQPST